MSAGVALFLLLFGWYALTTSGHTYSSDEETMLAAGESLATTGWFNIPRSELFLINRNRGVDGLSYSRYGPGQSLAAVPFILVGRGLALVAPSASGLIERLVVLMLPALVTATTALILYDWERRVGFSTRVALIVGLLYGLTSIAWPYSRTFFAEPLATFFLVVAAYGLRRTERRWWAIAGAAAVCALAVKVQVALVLPLIAGYGILAAFAQTTEAGRTTESTETSQGEHPSVSSVANRLVWQRVFGRLLFGLLGAALPLALLLLYNTRVFGGPLRTGYGSVAAGAVQEGGNWRQGLYGLTISTGKGILFFAPTIVLGLLGMFFERRKQWRESLLALAMLVLHLAFYSGVEYWHGDGSWGPRYLVFMMPFVYLPAAGLLTALGSYPRTWLVTAGRWVVGVLAVLGFIVQLMPILLNFNVYLDPQVSRPGARYFEPAASPLVQHPRIWLERATEWWWRIGGGPAGTAILVNDFSYSEGDRGKGELLPRWTYAHAAVQLNPVGNAPIEGRLVVGDHRPWPLPRANFELLLDGAPLANVTRRDIDGNQIRWELTFTLAPEQVRRGELLELRSDTWNPNRDTTDNPRNEDLGLLLESLELSQNGQPLGLHEALPIGPPQSGRRGLWLWYQDAPNHHLFDAWLWYLPIAGLSPAATIVILALIALPALAALFFGARGVIAALRAPAQRQDKAASSVAYPSPKAG